MTTKGNSIILLPSPPPPHSQANPQMTTGSGPVATSRVYGPLHLVEVRLELLKLCISQTAESERVGTKRNRVSSIVAASQSSSEDHASGWNTSDLETARSSRSEGELSAVEGLAAHVVVVLGNRVERIGLAALVNAAAADSTANNAAQELSPGAQAAQKVSKI